MKVGKLRTPMSISLNLHLSMCRFNKLLNLNIFLGAVN